jgi:hypothetical protein
VFQAVCHFSIVLDVLVGGDVPIDAVKIAAGPEHVLDECTDERFVLLGLVRSTTSVGPSTDV